MKTFAIRLTPGQDLKKELDRFIAAHDIRAGLIVTAMGSLSQAGLRFAGRPETNILKGDFEIVSLVGTLSPAGSHLHMAVSDEEGRTTGGHLKEGNIIRTTAEIVIGELDDVIFSRELDPQTGYDELKITKP